MVTPTYGTATLKGLETGNTYQVDFYIADVVGDLVNFDSGNGAGAATNTFWKCPENCVLTDLSIATGPTVMTQLIPTSDGGVLAGKVYRIANFLSTLAYRPNLLLGFKRGSNFGMIER